MPTYARLEIAFERGEGSWLYSTNGDKYLDFCSGIAVTALGHCHPALVASLKHQSERLWHCSNLYQIKEQEALSNQLCAASFADLVFVANSGAEAVECAIKLTRRHFADKGQPQRHRIITMKGAFHGRTLATLAAAGNEKYLKGYAPNLEGFDHVAFGDSDAVAAAITPETAAILLEPIQGEGGIHVAPNGYLRELRELADEHGLLLIYDEVQAGMGRTGTLFAYQSLGNVAPDVLCLAKGLGGGFPVSACLATKEAASAMVAGSHGSTFGGNPLACAVASTVLQEMLKPAFMPRVQAAGERFINGLMKIVSQHPNHPTFNGFQGVGLMIGMKCVPAVGEVVNALAKHKLLAVGASDQVLRLFPPLTVSDAEIDMALSIIAKVAKGI